MLERKAYANDFAWLVAAGAALKTVNVTEPNHPLKRTEEPNRFKLFQSDTGMLPPYAPVSPRRTWIPPTRYPAWGWKRVRCA